MTHSNKSKLVSRMGAALNQACIVTVTGRGTGPTRRPQSTKARVAGRRVAAGNLLTEIIVARCLAGAHTCRYYTPTRQRH